MKLTPAPAHARIHLLLLGLGLVVQRYVLAEAPGMPRVRVDPATHFFVDTSDRVRVFHGVNVVEKLPPFLPVSTGFDARNSLSEADILNLSSWGLNAVRLGVLWAGVMPQEGWVNATTSAPRDHSFELSRPEGFTPSSTCTRTQWARVTAARASRSGQCKRRSG